MAREILFKFRALNDDELCTITGGKLADNIRKARLEHHMTQELLAQELFVSRQAISLWEKGVREPDINTIIRMKELFQISFDKLLN